MVFAAVVHGLELGDPPQYGSLTGDLEALGERIALLSDSEIAHAAMLGLTAELDTDAGLREVLDARLWAVERRYLAVILKRAVDRGEIRPGSTLNWSAAYSSERSRSPRSMAAARPQPVKRPRPSRPGCSRDTRHSAPGSPGMRQRLVLPHPAVLTRAPVPESACAAASGYCCPAAFARLRRGSAAGQVPLG